MGSHRDQYRGELPTGDEFERLFRSSSWTEAFEVAGDLLAEALPHAWYAVCARRGGEVVGTALVLLRRCPARPDRGRDSRVVYRRAGAVARPR